jgi:dolichyl-phosphate-mannose-protein mannosyltransferase
VTAATTPATPARPARSDADTAPGGRPSAWQRARARIQEDPVVGWIASLVITVMAFLLRLWHLGTPHVFEFDETYYAKDAWSMLHFGYARNYVANADQSILAGNVNGQWQGTPEMIVHPDVGKWLIAIGEHFWGMDPFGWRIVSCVFGSLMILLMIRFVRQITGSTLLGCVAGLLLCFDGLEFVLSRLALLDIYEAFFVLAAVHCMVLARKAYRRRMADRLTEPSDALGVAGAATIPFRRGWGPVRGLLVQPWLLAAGVCWGLACGTKWEAAYVLAGFGVLYVAWCAGARRSFGVRWSIPKSLAVDGPVAFVSLVLVAVIVYIATWTGWMMHSAQFEALDSTQYTQYTGQGHCGGDKNESWIPDNEDTTKHWPTRDQEVKTGLASIPQDLERLWYYHKDVYTFHTNFLQCATHPYASQPAGWLLLNKGVGVAADTGIQPGTQGCTAAKGSDCLRQVLLLGTPALWWGCCLAALAALVLWIGSRDWRFGVAIVGIAMSWLPWLPYGDRPIFSYYAIVTLPFLILAATLVIGKLIGHGTGPSPRRTLGVIVSGAFFVLVLANFAWFWPIYTDHLLTHAQWLNRIWFQRWI